MEKIPKTQIGAIMGKAGSHMNQIRKFAKSFIHIHPETPGERTTERKVTIRGTVPSLPQVAN